MRRKTVTARMAGDRRGGVSIEFGMVIGAIVLIVVGTVEVGQALSVRSEMSHALGRVARVVNIDNETTEADIVERLELYLADHDTADLEVEIVEVEGTDFMEIAVLLPYTIDVPFVPASDITLRVATRAPMVSPTR